MFSEVLTPKDWKRLLQPLANETRIAILGSLGFEEKNLGELSRELNLPAYTVSHQLRLLQEAGLVDVRHEGRFHYFRIKPRLIQKDGEEKYLDLGCCRFRLSQLITAK